MSQRVPSSSYPPTDQEHTCEETGNDVILMKDRAGQVIGFEKLNFVPIGTDMPLVSLKPRRYRLAKQSNDQ